MPDFDEFEEKELERAIERDKKGKSSARRRKSHLPDTPLFVSYKNSSQPSYSELKKILKKKYKSPVTTLYISVTPDKSLRERKIFLTSFNSLKNMELQRQKHFVSSLPHDQQNILKNDLEDIEKFLTHYFDPHDAKTLIIIKSGNKINKIFKLHYQIEDRIVMDTKPYIVPLEALLGSPSTVLLVHISQDECEFFIYQFGILKILEKVRSFVPSTSVDASRPNKVQRHRQAMENSHFHVVQEQTKKYVELYGLRYIILLGEEKTLNLFHQTVKNGLREKTIAHVHVSPHEHKDTWLQKINQCLNRLETEHEEDVIKSLDDFASEGIIVSKLSNVLEAQNRFLIRKLLIDARLSARGFVCDKRHYLSQKDGSCETCGQKLKPVENIINELVEVAKLYKADLAIIRKKTNALKNYGGIVAVTYKS